MSKRPHPPAPDVFAHLDYRRFLEAWFQWKKATNPRYSHRAFARAAGIASPSLLLHITQGRRNLTPGTLPGFARAMKLDAQETRFLDLLRELDGARDEATRNEVMATINGTRRFQQARRVEGEGFRYLSTWYLPAVRELALCPGFRPDPRWIARTLRPSITVAQARDALETLQALGLLAIEGDRAVVHEVSVTTPHEVAGLAVHNYHREMLGRATDAIEGVRPAERHLGALTVAIPASLVPRLKRELQSTLEHLLETCDGAEEPAEVVYQLGVYCFPLSRTVEET